MYCVHDRDTKTKKPNNPYQRPCCKSFAEERLAPGTYCPPHVQISNPLCLNSRNAEWPRFPLISFAAVSAQHFCTLGLRGLGDETNTESSHKRYLGWSGLLSNTHKDCSRNRARREFFSFTCLNHRMILSLSTIPFTVLFSMHFQISTHELRIFLTPTYIYLNLDINMWESWQER